MMSRDKQIEELTEFLYDAENGEHEEGIVIHETEALAKMLYDAGYRKASDVAREIFEEIAKATGEWSCYCLTTGKWGYPTADVHKTLADLKKKYESEGANDEMQR